jgi:hypothetical protein
MMRVALLLALLLSAGPLCAQPAAPLAFAFVLLG